MPWHAGQWESRADRDARRAVHAEWCEANGIGAGQDNTKGRPVAKAVGAVANAAADAGYTARQIRRALRGD